MHTNTIILLIYSLLIFIGGLIGFLKKGSQTSLISGTFFALAMLACSYGIYKKNFVAYVISLLLSGFLALFFSYRYYLSQNFMPGGFVALVSAVVFIYTFGFAKIGQK